MNVGNKIKELRIKNNLTQEELAKKCGLSKNAIWNYENNKRNPKVEVLSEIAKALNISLNTLMGVDEKVNISQNGDSIKYDLRDLSLEEIKLFFDDEELFSGFLRLEELGALSQLTESLSKLNDDSSDFVALVKVITKYLSCNVDKIDKEIGKSIMNLIVVGFNMIKETHKIIESSNYQIKSLSFQLDEIKKIINVYSNEKKD